MGGMMCRWFRGARSVGRQLSTPGLVIAGASSVGAGLSLTGLV